MNDDFTKDDELEVDFDPKKIKDVLLEEDPLLVDDLGVVLDGEDEEEYTFDGDADDDEDF